MVEGYSYGSTAYLIYGFGCNEIGEIGLSDEENRKCPTLLEFCFEKDIVDIACGYLHTVLLTSDGHMYKCGVYADCDSKYEPLKLVSSLAKKSIHINRIFSGNRSRHLAAVTTTGVLYTAGVNTHGQLGLGRTDSTPVSEPTIVTELLGVADIDHIACSETHTIIKTTNGMLYACGENNYGQLGTPDGLDCNIPKPIPSFNTKRVLAVSCGSDFTIVSFETGGLMAFGNNDEGKLGIGIKSDAVSTPTSVLFQSCQVNIPDKSQNSGNLEPLHNPPNQDEQLEVEKQTNSLTTHLVFPNVACGDNHTVVVSEEGTVYVFGDNEFGQLGLGHNRNMVYAEILTALLRENIVDVACGLYHTVLLSDGGRVFSFGRNTYGELGLGNNDDYNTPQMILSLRAHQVQKLAAGSDQTFCVFEKPTSRRSSQSFHVFQDVIQDLRHMINNQLCSDVTFVVEGQKIYAHSFLLAARCEPLEKMLDGRMCDGSKPEITIPEYSYDVFLAFMEYLYTSNVTTLTSFSRGNHDKEPEKMSMKEDNQTEFILELLKLADQYLVRRLQKTCENALLLSMSVDNVCIMLKNAHFRNAIEFKKRCMTFILVHYAAVIITDGFVALPPELIREVSQQASKHGVTVPDVKFT